MKIDELFAELEVEADAEADEETQLRLPAMYPEPDTKIMNISVDNE